MHAMTRRTENDVRVEHSGQRLAHEQLEIICLEVAERLRSAPINHNRGGIRQRLADARYKLSQRTRILPDSLRNLSCLDDHYAIFSSHKSACIRVSRGCFIRCFDLGASAFVI